MAIMLSLATNHRLTSFIYEYSEDLSLCAVIWLSHDLSCDLFSCSTDCITQTTDRHTHNTPANSFYPGTLYVYIHKLYKTAMTTYIQQCTERLVVLTSLYAMLGPVRVLLVWVIDRVEGSHAHRAANGYGNAATLQVHTQDTLHNVLDNHHNIKLCYRCTYV